ncbi:MAG: hypothetical protein LBT86_08685 [Deltaproteobacteria bacterium]|nr:hypothetical protein [Deltaproteobacteria bacterium]
MYWRLTTSNSQKFIARLDDAGPSVGPEALGRLLAEFPRAQFEAWPCHRFGRSKDAFWGRAYALKERTLAPESWAAFVTAPH